MNDKIKSMEQEAKRKQDENDKYFQKKGELENRMTVLNDDIGLLQNENLEMPE